MVAEHEPIEGRQEFSPAKERFLSGKLECGCTKDCLIANTLTSTARPTDKSETIWDGYRRNLKLHDREPQRIVEILEDFDPDFFIDLPVRGEANFEKKKAAFIGEWCQIKIVGGVPQYGKPKLRKKAKVLVSIAKGNK